MAVQKFRVGITRDALRDDGKTVFDAAALKVLDDPIIEWEFIPENVKELSAAHAAAYDALCVLMPRTTAATLAGPNRRLKIVARLGVGYDNVDVPACTANGVILTITPEGVRRPVATSILTFILALSHKLFLKDRITRVGRWSETKFHMGEGLIGKTVGSIGMGNIGSELFRLLAPLNMKLIACDPAKTQADADKLGVKLTDMDSVLRDADFVCVNCFLSDQTKGLIGERELSLMKDSAYLINTARGPIVNEAALYKALTSKRIAGAALDVFEQEPASGDNPLFRLDNVIVTPHSICWTDECFRGNAEGAFRAAVAVAKGEVPKYVVNADVLQHPDIRTQLKLS
jgi:phosphoglycerate dehydrogenase-like enzyme